MDMQYMSDIMGLIMNVASPYTYNMFSEPDIDHDENDAKPARKPVAYSVHKCLYCEAVIPEGRDICPKCKHDLTPKIEGE